jgi:asparagine synthase (glutamine-hydrolysing)
VRSALHDAIEAPGRWQREQFALGSGVSALHRVLEHNFRTYLPEDLLVKADRCSMAHALEVRSPFLDTALIEYAQQLPREYLWRGRVTKRILKHAFSDLLPIEIQRRGKLGFGVPLGAWFRTDLRSYVHDRLGQRARARAYLSDVALDKLLAEHDAGQADHGQRLWTLLTFEVWLQQLASIGS